MGGQYIQPSHRRAVTAGADRAAADKSQPAVIKIIAVEVVDAHGRRAWADEAIDNVVIENADGAHVAMRHDVAADVAAAVRQTFGEAAPSRL